MRISDWSSDVCSSDLSFELDRVHRLIEGLPERCRRIFELRKIEGLPQREVAQRLGVADHVVENDVTKGLKLILQAIAEGEQAEIGRASCRESVCQYV